MNARGRLGVRHDQSARFTGHSQLDLAWHDPARCAPGSWPQQLSVILTSWTARADAAEDIASPPERMVVVTDHSRDLPRPIFESPEVNELCLANRFPVIASGVIEVVNTDLDRAVASQGIDLERSWNAFPAHLTADVLPDTFDQAFSRLVRQP